MKRIFIYIFLVVISSAGLCSCSSDEAEITPSEVSNLHFSSLPGQIILRWTTPQDGTVECVKVTYHDPRLDQNEKRLASVYADSIVIPDTRKKFGDYTFTVSTVSPSGKESSPQQIVAQSEAAPVTLYNPHTIALTVDMLSTNAQEQTEGDISNLLDGNVDTYFCTDWHGLVPGPHWFEVELPQPISTGWQFHYSTRNNASSNYDPTDFDVYGSTDGDEWFLIQHFDNTKYDLPNGAAKSFVSPVIDARSHPFQFLKFIVNKTQRGAVFFTMSEFGINAYDILDPEAEDNN